MVGDLKSGGHNRDAAGDLVTTLNREAVRDLRAFYKQLREKTSSEFWLGFSRSGATLESLKFKK